MAKQRFVNNFDFQFVNAVKSAPIGGVPESELGYGILQLNSSAAAALPTLSNGDWYMLTAFKKSGSVQSNIEIVKVLGVNEAAYVTGGETRIRVERAQEGTIAQTYDASDYISLRLTAAGTGNFLQATDNLNSLTDKPTARNNLGLKTGSLADTGTGATNVILGNDSRLSNPRTPTGGAGGALSGNYPNPGFAVDMATQDELNLAIATREPTITGGNASFVWRGNKTFTALTKNDVGLSNVDNTSNDTERNAAATLTNKTISLANNNILIVPSGNLVSTTLANALNELQLDLDNREANFQGNSVVSAPTCDIWGGSGNSKIVSGNNSINSFGTAPRVGATMKIVFSGSPLLINSSNLILNNGVSDLQIEPRDYAIVYAETLTSFLVYVIKKSGKAVTDSGLPVGTIISYSGNVAPAGFLLCPLAATELSRTAYAALNQQQADSGYPFGAGNGVSTFIMPWCPPGFSLIQANDNLGTYTSGDNKSHTHIQNEHNHVQNAHNHTYPINSTYGNNITRDHSAVLKKDGGTATTNTATATNQAATATNQNSGSPHNYPAGMNIRFAVKY